MNPERMYTVLLEPHFTEKSARIGEKSNQYGFKVARDATKQEIKEAVEKLFGVNVEDVTTLNVKPKVKRNFRGQRTKKKGFKKAYVRVQAGQDLDFAAAE